MKILSEIGRKIIRSGVDKEMKAWPPVCAAILHQTERPVSKPKAEKNEKCAE